MKNKDDCTGFSLGRLHMGGFVTPHMGGGETSAGRQSVNGGLMRGDIDLTFIDYIIN